MLPAILILMLIGAAAGLFATRIMRVNVDLPMALLVGVLGALLGGMGLRMVVSMGGWAGTLVLAIIGSIVLLWLYKNLRK